MNAFIDRSDLVDGMSYNAALNYWTDERLQVGVLFDWQQAAMNVDGSEAGRVTDMSIYGYHGTLTFHGGDFYSKVRPFAGVENLRRNMKRYIGMVALALSCSLGPVPAQAQSNDWEVVVAPYVLFGNLAGDAGVIPALTTPVDLGFGDLVKNLEAGALIHAEAWNGKWGVMADVIWLRLGSDVSLRLPLVLDIQVDEVIAEGFLARRFVWPERRLDVFAGIRYWDLALDLELEDTPRALDLGDSWVDPVVGGRFFQNLTDDWFVSARGDMGGFGIGSDFSWNVEGGVGYDLSEWFSLVAQYKALGVDFANDETGLDFLSYDTVTHGPVLGFVFRF